MVALKMLLLVVSLPFTMSASTSTSELLASCSDGTTYTVSRFFTMDAWLSAAILAALLHLLLRKTRLSRMPRIEVALYVATIALFVAAPWLITLAFGIMTERPVGMIPGVMTIDHLIGVKGALGVLGFAGLFAYPLEERWAAAGVLMGGAALAAGLFVAFPSSSAEKPEPLVMIGHGVCDSDDGSYGF